ncbi:MAG TPA: adenosylmethionine--8-amino-7-oxononanoate transaminase [Candidatus Methylomirabilis sp.]|nr:adenosylmethionine--8-amino-7-oxononanoate transaminase [Candidatus Methylomirabilis sp.]
MISKAALQAKDHRYLWHPFTQMQEWFAEEPLIIDRGEGNFLIDIDGNRYLDGVSSLWCNVHGHNRREIAEAIIAQLGRIAHSTLLGLSHPPAILLAERLVEIAPPGLTKVFYSDNGATAVEIALKMAFQYWQQKGADRFRGKTTFLYFSGAYHGDTLGAVSVGGIDLFHHLYKPLLFEALPLPAPYSAGEREAALKEAQRMIEARHPEVAGLIMEPVIQGASGMRPYPSGFTRAVWELCRDHEILFIADEVATGFGRTGKMFACEHEGVVPDLLAVAKGLTGGYLPLAATLTTQEVFDAFLGAVEQQKTFFHGHTYTGNPLGCAAALANLEIFQRDRVLEHLEPKVAFLKAGLERLRPLRHVGEIRHVGLMGGIELFEDVTARRSYPPGRRMGHRVIKEARRHGVIIRPLGDVIVVMPPLSVTTDEIDALLHVVHRAIKTVTEDDARR